MSRTDQGDALGAREIVRAVLPREARDRIALGRVQLRRALPGRKLPDFVVIGAQKAGTSSLFKYLSAHPDVAAPVQKETGFFCENYGRGLGWYRAHFPPGSSPRVAFEASPNYLFCLDAPARAAALLPDARLIALLRDPRERAISQYWHMTRRGFETRELDEALLAPESVSRPKQCDAGTRRFGYVSRGYYAEQLRRWLDHVPAERLLVLKAEDLFSRTPETYANVLAFLGLRPFELTDYPNFTPGKKVGSTSPRVRDALQEIYAPHTDDLQALLGPSWSWW